ncbi:NAD-dependent dehydratase [Pseudomonas gingeri NCPPB 3146 = LMG 5327]|uniref:SDR family oxidoreductase n=2 Tax=Pseudomonas gingeri TaxID=117681 RepID=A0A7Y7XX21_9PSED|nr:SDR family oxidoreductase [Pseudomonas gingeri]NVZ24025.1 SDR family oxidoreductase [Pseudomonas gingeri]NWC13893.1 SDR family oxidoreductase [Pseudomonas gingeri]NWE68310.1 SDR family oxidoreductase [Pseudomonas gingeri]PNQ90301.1 NAD-dependent dehydratase [Pseudomonas gingeri NCPPB 3146 = LMG 5327]
MRIFLTGATGFIGSALVPELIRAGHEVTGMARSEVGAQALIEAGAQVHRGDLEDPESLRAGAAEADGVIHAAFDHDFSRFAANCAKDRRAIEALGSALSGSDRPLIITSVASLGSAAPGQLATEDVCNTRHANPRTGSELTVNVLLDAGLNISVVRLPQVHNPFRQGLITPLVAVAREKGVSAYVEAGRNRWAACHLLDVARLYRLALEKGEPGARYHAVGEEGVSSREIAESIGRGLKVPVVSITALEAVTHFGWLEMFVGLDMPASSVLTQSRLDWHPTGPGLIADLDQARFA